MPILWEDPVVAKSVPCPTLYWCNQSGVVEAWSKMGVPNMPGTGDTIHITFTLTVYGGPIGLTDDGMSVEVAEHPKVKEAINAVIESMKAAVVEIAEKKQKEIKNAERKPRRIFGRHKKAGQ